MIYDTPIFLVFSDINKNCGTCFLLFQKKKWVDYRNPICYMGRFVDDIQDDYTGPGLAPYEQQLGHEITVINQSTLYDWHEDDVTRGWYRQQFAKMLLPTYATTKYNIICDSECMFSNPIQFLRTGNLKILYADYEFPW